MADIGLVDYQIRVHANAGITRMFYARIRNDYPATRRMEGCRRCEAEKHHRRCDRQRRERTFHKFFHLVALEFCCNIPFRNRSDLAPSRQDGQMEILHENPERVNEKLYYKDTILRV